MSSPFDASASLLGYLFQVRLGLTDAVRRLRRGETFTVGIETLDDVVFETAGSPAELFQTKHHLNHKAGLGDASSDIWKSIRIWVEGRATGAIAPDAVLYLLTTASASTGTAVSYLRADDERDSQKARERLDGVAQSSERVENAKAYKRYLALPLAERTTLLERVLVLDQHADISRLEGAMKAELALTVEREYLGALVTRLEGWWFQRAITHLRRLDGGSILSEEVDAEIDRLRDQFRPGNLPIDDDLQGVDIDETAFAGHLFVEQLRLIKLTNTRLLNAMRQYFRAFEQRSRWIREGFLVIGELDRYDRRLVEEWEIHFNLMKDDLGEQAAEEAMKAAARKLYGWAELEASILIRPACTEGFVPRGSLQLLADKAQVGWHPEFLSRLQHLLTEEGV